MPPSRSLLLLAAFALVTGAFAGCQDSHARYEAATLTSPDPLAALDVPLNDASSDACHTRWGGACEYPW